MVVRICGIIIFHLRKLQKAKFFILCDVIFLVRLLRSFVIERFHHTKIEFISSRHCVLVYTTQVNSAFRAIWLVPQSRDIKYYSPPGGFRVKKMSRETHFIRKWSNFLGIAIKLVLYILKQLFASVSVTSGSVNIHHYSPPLLRIIVKYPLCARIQMARSKRWSPDVSFVPISDNYRFIFKSARENARETTEHEQKCEPQNDTKTVPNMSYLGWRENSGVQGYATATLRLGVAVMPGTGKRLGVAVTPGNGQGSLSRRETVRGRCHAGKRLGVAVTPENG